MLTCGNTRGYELLAAGELDSFLDGRSRKITVESIRRYVSRRLAVVPRVHKVQEPRAVPSPAERSSKESASDVSRPTRRRDSPRKYTTSEDGS
jgi:hypothetical protein